MSCQCQLSLAWPHLAWERGSGCYWEARFGTIGTKANEVLGTASFWVFPPVFPEKFPRPHPPEPNLLGKNDLLNSLTQQQEWLISLYKFRWQMLGHQLAGRWEADWTFSQDVTWWSCLLLLRFDSLLCIPFQRPPVRTTHSTCKIGPDHPQPHFSQTGMKMGRISLPVLLQAEQLQPACGRDCPRDQGVSLEMRGSHSACVCATFVHTPEDTSYAYCILICF